MTWTTLLMWHIICAKCAARVVSNTGKFDRGLTHLLHSELHWLDVPQRILHKLGVTVHRCLQDKAPWYLVNCCHPTSDVASSQRLHIFQPPLSRRTTTSSQHARPSGVLRRRSDGLECAAWRPPRPVAQCQQFPEEAKDASVSECTWTLSALEVLGNALYKFKTYLLTYFINAQIIITIIIIIIMGVFICSWLELATIHLCHKFESLQR